MFGTNQFILFSDCYDPLVMFRFLNNRNYIKNSIFLLDIQFKIVEQFNLFTLLRYQIEFNLIRYALNNYYSTPNYKYS